jgi:uncharacterized membrane protein YgaE (UPF0421/DUF939 family)
VQVTVWESVSRGLQRVLGVVVGVLVAFGFARLAGVHPWTIGLIIFISLLAGRAMRLGQQGSVQVPISALLVLVLGASTGGYGYDRVVDTALGAGVGIVVNLVLVPRTHLAEAQAETRRFANALAALLGDVAASLGDPGPEAREAHLGTARDLSRDATSATRAARRAEESVRWNPAGRRDRAGVDRLRTAIATLNLVERQVRGIARSLADIPANQPLPTEPRYALARLLDHVAGELGTWVEQATSATSGPEPQDDAELYQGALGAIRAYLPPQSAAIAAAIAVDAHRISEELRWEPGLPPTRLRGWHALFGPTAP